MSSRLLVDGYNVIFRDNDLRAAYRGDPEAGRRMLLQAVNRYATSRSIRVVVAFDGGRTDEGRISPPSMGNVEAVFVKDADRYLRERVAGSGSADPPVVVSSDESDITRFARNMGARVMSAEEFLATIRQVDRIDGRPDEKPAEETKAGVDYWLERFQSRKETD